MGAGAGIEIVMTLSLIASVDVSHGTYVCVCMQGIFIMSHTSHACQKIACAMRRLALNHQTHMVNLTHTIHAYQPPHTVVPYHIMRIVKHTHVHTHMRAHTLHTFYHTTVQNALYHECIPHHAINTNTHASCKH